MIGQLLDRRYQVVQILGTGGFGQTYIAQDTRRPGNPLCVVKHLKPANSDPKVLGIARRLFKNEAETLEQLGYHDQIPRLLAYFEENQEFYLVQELIEGHRLSTELQHNQRWNENQVIQLLQEVLGILEFVHSQNVIHRDVKPDNLIRRRLDNKLVLVDFGAVKQVRTQLVTVQRQPTASVAIGTPGYMSTEQGQGKPRPNSDIYALGIIGIQALTGMSPTQLQTLEDANTGELIWQNLVSVSPGLERVLSKMVSYHFKDRYQSATEALQALQQAFSSYYTPTQSATPQSNTTVSPASIATASPSAPISKSSTGAYSPKQHSFPVAATSSQPTSVSSPRQWQLLAGIGAATVVVAVGVLKAMELVPQTDKPAPVTSVSPSPNLVRKPEPEVTPAAPITKSTTQPQSTPTTSAPKIQPQVTPAAPIAKSTTQPQPKTSAPKIQPQVTPAAPIAKSTTQPQPKTSDSSTSSSEPPLEPEESSQNIDQFPIEPEQPSDQAPPPQNPSVDTDVAVIEQAKAELATGEVSTAINLLQSVPEDSSAFADAKNLIAQVEQTRSMCENNPYWGQQDGEIEPGSEPNLEPGDEVDSQATQEWNQLKCWHFSRNPW